MGKPVVSTPIEELKRFPKFAKPRTDQPRWSGAWVKIGKNAKEWEKLIKNLLSQPLARRVSKTTKKVSRRK